MTRIVAFTLLAATLTACTGTEVSRDATQTPPMDDRAELHIQIPGVLP
ncbi:hypothetical protein [Candidatus Rhodobacter oscarellae]|nr:hypothetical protein [Candidatus Rhodobacter lobularis]